MKEHVHLSLFQTVKSLSTQPLIIVHAIGGQKVVFFPKLLSSRSLNSTFWRKKQHLRPASPSWRPRREHEPPGSGCACWLHFDRSFPLSAPERHIQKAFLIQCWEPHKPIRPPPYWRLQPSHSDMNVFGTRPLSHRNISRQCLDSAVEPSASKGKRPQWLVTYIKYRWSWADGVHIEFSSSQVLIYFM